MREFPSLFHRNLNGGADGCYNCGQTDGLAIRQSYTGFAPELQEKRCAEFWIKYDQTHN